MTQQEVTVEDAMRIIDKLVEAVAGEELMAVFTALNAFNISVCTHGDIPLEQFIARLRAAGAADAANKARKRETAGTGWRTAPKK